MPYMNSCEVCSQYERQLRDVETDLQDAVKLASDLLVDRADVILRSQRVTELQFQVDAAKLVFGIHRRRDARAGETGSLGADLGCPLASIDGGLG